MALDEPILNGLKESDRAEAAGGRSNDDLASTLHHAQILRRKGFLRRLYRDFYSLLREAVGPTDGRVVVELGSGGGFIKEVIADAITSDVLPLPTVDRVFSASQIPYENQTVDAIVMFNVFHHIPDVRGFFKEAVRCLKSGGRIVMIEPANTLFARFIYTRFHHERFDPEAQWAFASEGPLSSANGALPWIVFHRDRMIFEQEFPDLAVVYTRCHTPLRYLLSGGFTLPSLVPAWSYSLVRGIEFLLRPLAPQIGLFETIMISRR